MNRTLALRAKALTLGGAAVRFTRRHGRGSSPSTAPAVPPPGIGSTRGQALRSRISTLRPLRNACLLGFLVVSALAVAAAGTLPSYRWLGWVALVPVFVAIRVCGPFGALAAGAAWGAAYYGLATTVFGVPFRDGLSTPVLLMLAPGLYCAGGAWLTRWIGFSPFVLGVGWMGVEAALAPLDANALAAPAAATPLLHSLARGLGYVVLAALVGYVNALLASTVTGLAARTGAEPITSAACGPQARVDPKASLHAKPAYALRSLRPRAPPSAEPRARTMVAATLPMSLGRR